MYDVIVIGLGASGLFTLANISKNIKALGIERNLIAGKKLRITGGGRCNLTQTKDVKSLVNAYTHPSFVRPILYSFNNDQLMKYFKDRGFELLVNNERVYPKSQSAETVAEFFLEQINKSGHNMLFNEKVIKIDYKNSSGVEDEQIIMVKTNKSVYKAKAVVVATGGASYPATGSDGKFISENFSIVPFEPALCHMYFKENFFSRLAGVSMSVNIKYQKMTFGGEMLFAGEFCTGPVIYDLSNYIKQGDKFFVDFIPSISEQKLIEAIKCALKDSSRKLLKNVFMDNDFIIKSNSNITIPQSFIKYIFEILNLDKCICAELKNKDLKKLINMMKNCEITIDKKAPIDNAIVTMGGVNINEIDNKNMCIKSSSLIMVVGEAIELVGNCGGYNLQFAFSSGMRAAKYINSKFKCMN